MIMGISPILMFMFTRIPTRPILDSELRKESNASPNKEVRRKGYPLLGGNSPSLSQFAMF